MMGAKSELLGSESVRDPYPAYGRLREEQPVCRMKLRDGLHCWLVSRYDDARVALADPRLSRDPRRAGSQWQAADRGRPLEDGANLGIHMLTRDPPDHTRLRRLVSDTFTPARAERMRKRVQAIADSLVDAVEDHGKAELIAEFAYPFSIAVISEVLGIPAEDQDIFRQWTSNAVAPEPGKCPATPPPGPGGYLQAFLAAKRLDPGDDLVSELIVANAEDQLSEAELLSMIFLLLIAGHENTVGLIGNGVLALAGDPDQLALLCDQPHLVDSAVEEVLRYDGPMELAAWRFTTEPVTIGGTLIPAGEPVLIALAGAHRDPCRFTAPDRFDITRTHNPHLGFGHGIHYCVGAPLARLEGRVALGTLLRRLPDLAIAVPVDQIRRQPSFVTRGLHELPVTFTPIRSPRRG